MAQNNSANANSTTPLSATNGGIGVSNPTANGILVANGSSAVSSTVLTNGQLLIGSTGMAPSAASLTSTGSTISVTGGAGTLNVDLAAPVSVPNGGTGATSLTDHGVLLGSGTGAITPTAALTNGQLLIGSTGNDPAVATLTAGTNITITNGAGSITIDAAGGGGSSYYVVAGNSGDQNNVTGTGTSYDLSWSSSSLSGFTTSGSTGFVVPATGKYLVNLTLNTTGYVVYTNSTQLFFANGVTTYTMADFNSFPIVSFYGSLLYSTSIMVDLTVSQTVKATFRVSGEESDIIDIFGDGGGFVYPRLTIINVG